MKRLYHSLSFGQLLAKHKPLFFTGIVVFSLAVFLSPLLKYLPSTLSLAKDFFFTPTSQLRLQEGRTNILVLGLGGPKNEPSGLTDTIIFFSIDHLKNDSLLLSIPRDIWVPQMQAKLNTAYYYGNMSEGLGMEWTKEFVSEIVGQPIHYTVVVSFDGFVKAVDLLGGLDINIERSFIDRKYPIPGKEDDPCSGDPETLCRYETISFEKGPQYFNGETALKFARSRQAEGEEGTDFARAQRQQTVILAFKDKILSADFLLNPKKASQLIEFITTSLETDVPHSHIGPLGRLLFEADRQKIRSYVLSQETKDVPGLLVNPRVSKEYGNQWVLVPRSGDWKETQEWVVCILSGKECPTINGEEIN